MHPTSSRSPKLLLVLAAVIAMPLTPSPSAAQQTVQAQARANHVAKGTFTVQMKPLSESGFGEGNANLGRLSLEKTFEGDLVAVGKGEMLTAVTQTKGSAGYVAIERVTGTLHGRKGSFVLQHSGQMDRGAQNLAIRVVADSGAGDLIGLEGTLKIRIESGKHYYDLEYSLPELVK
jgi:Protein of unknown function (DUF3224)